MHQEYTYDCSRREESPEQFERIFSHAVQDLVICLCVLVRIVQNLRMSKIGSKLDGFFYEAITAKKSGLSKRKI